jgi:iron complex outermembrane receptor protein
MRPSVFRSLPQRRTSLRGGPSRGALIIALAASFGATAVVAQTGPSTTSAPSAPPVATATPTSEATSLEEVTVTARKTAERLIDVPVAASVMSAVQLQRYNTTDLEQLDTQVPGLIVVHADGGGGGGSILIRGVGQQAEDYGSEEPVAIVIDGMAFTQGHILDAGFFDMQSLEVLKGPQSLFFGKNSPAGVVSINSNNPGSEFGGYVRASYEFRTEDPVIEAAVDVPVSDKLAFRFAVHAEDMQGGWLNNVAQPIPELAGFGGGMTEGAAYNKYPQTKELLGRITMVWKPTDRFTLTLKAFGSVKHDDDANSSGLGGCGGGVGSHLYYDGYPDPDQICTGKLTWNVVQALPPAAVTAGLAGLPAADAGQFFLQSTNYIYTLNMNYRFDKFDVTSITGIWDHREREYTGYSYDNYGGITSKQGQSGVNYTEELRVHTHLDFPVNFTIGGFMERDQYDHYAPIDLLPLGPYPLPGPYYGTYMTWNNVSDNSNQSYSFFGQANWKILPNLELAGGVRWSHENRSTLDGNTFNAFDALVAEGYLTEAENPFSPAGVWYRPTLSYTNTSPEVTLTWHPQKDLTVYGAYKTGYLSAGISNPGSVPNLTSLPGNPNPTPAQQNAQLVYGGETVKGFEGGVKGVFFGGRLSGDIDGYRYAYSNLQVDIFNPQTISFTIQNAASSVDEGVEGQMAFRATPELTLHSAFSYSHLAFNNYAAAECYPGQTTLPIGAAPVAGDCMTAIVGGAVTTYQNQSGKRYGEGPFVGSWGLTYDRPLNDKWSLLYTADVQYTSQGYDILSQPGTATAAHTIVNMSAKLYQNEHKWEIALIGTNLTNVLWGEYGNKPLGNPGDLDITIHPPREVTLQVTRFF